MAELNVATLRQEQLDRLMHQLEESALEIATLTAERDSARQQSTVNASASIHAPAHSEEPIVISSGTPTHNDSVGQRSGSASEGAAHSMPGMERNRTAPSPREPCESRRHVEFAATSGEYAVTAPMPLKPHRPPCFDPSQRGGPTVQSWVFTMNPSPGVHSARQPSTARGMRGAQGFGAFRANRGFNFDASEAAHLAATRAMLATTLDGHDIILGRDWLRRYNPRIDWTTGSCTVRSSGNWVELPRWQSPGSSTDNVNAITMKRVVAAGADVFAVDIAIVEEADKSSDFQKLMAAVPSELQELYGSFEYTVMPFGLTNAPATFQMTMNEAFRPLLDKCVIIYLDDILVYCRDKQQHLEDLEAVFTVLDQH
ncbi:unnamed protein product [Closterium sp. NIES-54]